MLLASDWLAFHADRTPDKVAMVDEFNATELTYAQFNERASKLGAYMQDEWAIQKGDRVAILAKNSVDYYVFQYACTKIGAMMLPINWRLAIPEILFILNDAEVKGLIYDPEFADHVPTLIDGVDSLSYKLRLAIKGFTPDETPDFDTVIGQINRLAVMAPDMQHDDPMTIMYTSGTTGRPKGVLITHGMTYWNAINISIPSGLNQNSVHYVVLPTFHTAGLNLYANPIIHWGGKNIIGREFDPAHTLDMIADKSVGMTHFFGVPAIYQFMAQHKNFESTDLSRIESWGCGGAPLHVPVLETYAKRGAIIQLGFGMTETSPTVFLIAKRHVMNKPTSVGKPMLHTRVRIVRPDFSDVDVNEVGEVVIAGANVTPAYWRREDANQDSFTTDKHGIRWLHSGDAGTIDEDGCIYIVDRYKDMYISGGENVYPAEVEQVIFQLEAVADVAVIGVPDEKWGEVGKAILVLKPDHELDLASLVAHCTQNLAKYKVPKSLAYIEELPRNASGKVLKRELRKQFITN